MGMVSTVCLQMIAFLFMFYTEFVELGLYMDVVLLILS